MTINASNGALALASGSPFVAATGPISVAFDASGQFLYVANLGTNNISAFSVDSTTGATTQLTGSPFTGGTGPLYATVDPGGKFLYVSNQSSKDISRFQIDPTAGTLSNLVTATTINLAPSQIVFSK
jgi:6-phosphogluconolactonase (cycloisomerase 2 family)